MTKSLDQQREELEQTRKKVQQSVIDELQYLDRKLQRLIDVLQPIRQSAPGDTKYKLSYVSRKVDLAGKAIGMALEKLNDSEG